jgi:hypothetical protein
MAHQRVTRLAAGARDRHRRKDRLVKETNAAGPPEPSLALPVGSLRFLRERWPFALLLLVAFAAAIAYREGLDFELFRDEYWYWRQTQWFLDRWPPSLEELRNYPEPMTPLSFLIWGVFELATGAGMVGARVVTIAFGVALLSLIGLQRDVAPGTALRASIGLAVFPYTLPLSIHIYTDMPAAFFTVAGFWLYARQRAWWAGLSFVLAIATRQYMVVFPAALAAAELAPRLLPTAVLRVLGIEPPAHAPSARLGGPGLARVLPIALAAASVLGWVALFGGLGPQQGIEDWPRHNISLASLEPGFALYFLTCVGAYFVVVETLLFWRWAHMAALLRSRKALWLAVAVALLFVAFSPLRAAVPMGPLNRTAAVLLPPEQLGLVSDAIRLAGFAFLAWLACVRFARIDLVFWLLLASATMMLASYDAWEKYNLALLATLWFLRSRSDLERPFDLWTALGRGREAGRPAAAGRA